VSALRKWPKDLAALTAECDRAIAQLETDPERRRARLLQHLKTVPSLSAAQALLNDAARTTLDDAATTAFRPTSATASAGISGTPPSG